MSASSPHRSTQRSGLLGKLMARVRPEFRVEVYLADPDDPVLGRRPCAAPDCDRSRAEHGLCCGHAQRWRARGRPTMTVFLADPGPILNGRRNLTPCSVTGCRYGSNGFGFCTRHRSAWTRDGQPDPDGWAARVGLLGPPDPVECLLPFCTLWTENARQLYCKSHATRWVQLGRPDSADYLTHCLQRGKARIDFRGLVPQLKLELQYAVQCRHDQATIITAPAVVAWTIRLATGAGVTSLLDRTTQQWRELAGPKEGSYQRFLIFAGDVVETLDEGTGWDVEYPRDIWRLHRLPGLTASPGKRPQPRINLRFDRMAQPWLRTLAKRWARLRLSSGLSPATVQKDIQGLTRFSTFLTESAPQVHALAGIDRTLLERYLAWLVTQPIGRGAKEDAVTAPGGFFQAIRQHGWDPTLPTTAVFFPGDMPARPPRVTRRVAEHVMAQVEAPANLDRWPNPEGRLITIILIRCGLRATDACTLAFDCLLRDGQGAPYLRYFNNKMRREAAVPIDEELESEIRAQQQRVTARWPDRHPHLFPALVGNAGGQNPITYYSYRGMLNTWLDTCQIRDEHGRPAHLTPHQWRHTFACRLINRDVPQEVVRVLLDHESHGMTAHYARITDQTVRRRWEAATKVNIKGERVMLDPQGPLAQAQWAKTRYGIATQTLPNGYCGLPLQRSCPHANACLTCPVFLTGPEFLPELREQHRRTLTLIDVSTRQGQTRMVEMNQQVLTNLERMIGEVETSEQEGADDAAG
ncbi:tyrosine-type recombinase/integrase [Mycobacterium canetti]|uniref:tyrosine-type recombinase/integrase n=1 Tax=Mycobacterium canetti TaxID=78331 RepID=UPI0032E4DD74